MVPGEALRRPQWSPQRHHCGSEELGGRGGSTVTSSTEAGWGWEVLTTHPPHPKGDEERLTTGELPGQESLPPSLHQHRNHPLRSSQLSCPRSLARATSGRQQREARGESLAKSRSFKDHHVPSVPDPTALIPVVITDLQLLLFHHNFCKISPLFMVIFNYFERTYLALAV